MITSIVSKPWGHYRVLAQGRGDYLVKEIRVLPGHRLSLQRHLHRSEHWLVVAGMAHVEVSGERLVLSGGDSADIPRRALHRLACLGGMELVLIETQLGHPLSEDDIERVSDDYGRAPA